MEGRCRRHRPGFAAGGGGGQKGFGGWEEAVAPVSATGDEAGAQAVFLCALSSPFGLAVSESVS
jgi:hypothetical protein